LDGFIGIRDVKASNQIHLFIHVEGN